MDVSSVPSFQFATALNKLIPTTGWRTELRWIMPFAEARDRYVVGEEGLKVVNVTLPHGYARPPLNRIFPFERRLRAQLLRRSRDPKRALLICTSPFFAPVAEGWAGPVVYHSLDFTYAYKGLNAARVQHLDGELCRIAKLVCPVSERIADYFVEMAGCDPGRIRVLPNATRSDNIRGESSVAPDDLPPLLRDMTRPIAGIIGNLADNLDWGLLETIIRRLPGFSWVFVGPVNMRISDRTQRRARSVVINAGSHVRFTGPQPYETLQGFARSFDVALLPYRFREPTLSGSATRFYEHLAACRPMLATPHVAELRRKEPLVCLCETSEQFIEKLRELEGFGFVDGQEKSRWLASRHETWEARARTMFHALAQELVEKRGFLSSADAESRT